MEYWQVPRCRTSAQSAPISMRKTLIDLNIILDMINKREDHASAVAVFDRCVKKLDRGYVCAHEITTLAYFLGKEKQTRNKQSTIIRSLLRTLQAIPTTATILTAALDSPIGDYEDAVVEVSGLQAEVDLIITRDLGDYSQSRVPVLTAADYLAGNLPT